MRRTREYEVLRALNYDDDLAYKKARDYQVFVYDSYKDYLEDEQQYTDEFIPENEWDGRYVGYESVIYEGKRLFVQIFN